MIDRDVVLPHIFNNEFKLFTKRGHISLYKFIHRISLLQRSPPTFRKQQKKKKKSLQCVLHQLFSLVEIN